MPVSSPIRKHRRSANAAPFALAPAPSSPSSPASPAPRQRPRRRVPPVLAAPDAGELAALVRGAAACAHDGFRRRWGFDVVRGRAVANSAAEGADEDGGCAWVWRLC
jgi:hypothetical protein